ncbi:fimbrial biogenesis outer membrane usher protein [Vibrio sp. RC586]|uniref:fimbria/pilus outer membrane usher protein n=1 Tax=Vibrio sp. RC586 TaxID=675815 RepID=UPI0001BB805C|nr:fimbria/pilus outer membrane usher protein [Vibrio sp. RC586]EEY99520.1 fimbrial biogenesis outer membrane usher protein [Vibrio sp. RC586]
MYFILIANFLLFFSFSVFADDNIEFDSSFLRLENVDITKFSQSTYVQPGVYKSTIYLNNTFFKYDSIAVNNNGLCLPASIFVEINLDFNKIPDELIEDIKSGSSCIYLETHIEGSSLDFDISLSRVDIQIPQVYLSKNPRGYTDPALWDEGIDAAFVSYNINAYNSVYNDSSSVSAYINSGLNVGGWYFRHKGNAIWSSADEFNYSNINSFLEKPIPEINGKATVGLVNTEGKLFDSTRFFGAQLISQTQMLPESQRGYAPQIRGVARSNARVTVSQNEKVIYETTVSPGEFLIDDLYPSGHGGYLDVVIYEANGSEQHFSVPYDSMPQLLRLGAHEYFVALGQYDDDSLLSNPLLLEGGYQRGVHNSVTIYGGLQGNQDYIAAKAGVAVGTPFGAISADITQSHTQLPREYEDLNGQSYELQYSKNITSTGSSISLGGYRYSTEGYLDYKMAMRARDAIERGSELKTYNSKNRFVLNAGQQLYGSFGQLQFTGIFENSWKDEKYLNQYQLSYSNGFKSISYGIGVNRNEDENRKFETNYSFNFSLPLSVFSNNTQPQLRIRSFHDEAGSRQQIGLSDIVGDESQFSYGISTTRDNRFDDSSLDLSVGYIGKSATLSSRWSRGNNYNTQNIGVSGSIIGHSGGVTFTPFTGDTFALIEAKGAEDASVKGYRKIKIDSNGYAAVPNLQGYRENNLALDLTTAPLGIEVNNASRRVIPFEGAIVKLNFETQFSVPILVQSHSSGGRLPFGSVVKNVEDETVGYVAQNNQLFVRVGKPEGKLLVDLGERTCSIAYSLSDEQLNSESLAIVNSNCL